MRYSSIQSKIRCQTRLKRSNHESHTNLTSVKGGLKAKFFSSYVKKWIRLGQKWSPKKFQRDDVIMGSTEVK